MTIVSLDQIEDEAAKYGHGELSKPVDPGFAARHVR